MLLKQKLVTFIFLLTTFLGLASPVFAQATISAQQAGTVAAATTTNPFQNQATVGAQAVNAPNPNDFVPDEEVTTVGKRARRAEDFLNWTIIKGSVPQGGDTPIRRVWQYVERATFIFSVLLVIAVGFWLMIRRGKDIKLMRFLPLFVFLLIYIFLSYAIVNLLYQLIEGLMRYFLSTGRDAAGNYIPLQTNDLLHVAFDYNDYTGLRAQSPDFRYAESADTSLLLVKLTTWTYMAMAGIMIVRQVILWFFIIISPLLALLIPFPLIRNTAKIWVGEFFRWLLYGLLFSLFLKGLVVMWQLGIPLQFGSAATPDTVRYPTAVRILLGGPNYQVDPANWQYTSINNVDTFVNYVVALIMLWVVIILPWILLRIFRDMISNWFKTEGANNVMTKISQTYTKFMPGRTGEAASLPAAPALPAPQTPPPASTGRALELPFRKVNIVARDVAVNQTTNNETMVNLDREISVAQTQDLSRYIGMNIPKITDIAKFDMNQNSRSTAWSTLQKLGNPALVAKPEDMQNISNIRNELSKRSRAGDDRATTILQAAQTAGAISNVSTVSNATTIAEMEGRAASGKRQTAERVRQGAQRGANVIAQATAQLKQEESQKVVAQATAASKHKGRVMPVVNKMQQISLNDYEEVKKMWLDHYQQASVPQGSKAADKTVWIKEDIETAETAINLLGSIDQQAKQKGLEMVANLLPFLLLGGFSEQETIAYLKAKVEAAKQVLGELEAKEAGRLEASAEDNLEVSRPQTIQAQGHLAASVEAQPSSPTPNAFGTPSESPASPQSTSSPLSPMQVKPEPEDELEVTRKKPNQETKLEAPQDEDPNRAGNPDEAKVDPVDLEQEELANIAKIANEDKKNSG